MNSPENVRGAEGNDDDIGVVKEEISNPKHEGKLGGDHTPSTGKISTSSTPGKESSQETSSSKSSQNYVIMQWNQKDLTLLKKAADGYKASRDRAVNVARTIRDHKSGKGPAVCVFEEVRTGGGGERAVEFIVELLNYPTTLTHLLNIPNSENWEQILEKEKKEKKTSNKEEKTWDYRLSGLVNPLGRRRELYAIIWCKEIMGNIEDDPTNGHRLMTKGFHQLNPSRTAASAERDNSVESTQNTNDTRRLAESPSLFIGRAEIDLTDVHTMWQGLHDLAGNVSLYFDRAPVLFSFSKVPGIDFTIHIIVCHSATGGESKSPHQNMIETACLQSICTQATKKEDESFVVLLGDFNTAEDHNQTEFMWDEELPFQYMWDKDVSFPEDVSKLFESTREAFLSCYYRGVPSALPTNVFPFLAGENATPKHNDDIWLPKKSDKMKELTNVGTLDGSGNNHKGVVITIPDWVLHLWDLKTRAYFDEIGNAKLSRASKHTLNRLLSMTWSDHRPISVDLSPVLEAAELGQEVLDEIKWAEMYVYKMKLQGGDDASV
ncbi:hypothetical protein TL16_g02301 [Triparma laevis f. inornata]|uniref:Endonuclease/exonuclease/phosphatase domain-containing protein n=1 Tax=Triparma laevis f. inornata TaxID=1714386 RepID=A0A9W6ZTN7_9STRA|nr:hypothetical protein TL16_g02301 [Triparma laevis f. inornata]